MKTLMTAMAVVVFFATLHSTPVLSQPLREDVRVHTTVADFSGCGIDNGASVTNIAGGEVRLPALVEDYFDQSSLDTTRWTGNASIAGGIVTVDASYIRSIVSVDEDDLPVTVEGRIQFVDADVGSGFGDFGLGKETEIPGPPNVLLITDDAGNVYANTYQPDTSSPQRTLITGFDWTEYQDVRFVLSTDQVDYYVNGSLEVSHTLTTSMTTVPMYLWFYDEWWGYPFRADWLRVAIYPATDVYTSCPVIAGHTVGWGNLAWEGDTPAGTSVSFKTRSSEDGESYSDWEPLGTGNAINSPDGSYLQYQITLSTTNPNLSPQVDEVGIMFNTAPTVEDDTFAVDENSPNGTSVGTVSASDPDEGDSLTYGITAGDTGNAFAIGDSTGEITVGNSSALDYETTPSFALTVVVTDTSYLTDSASITINLNDVNDAPTVANPVPDQDATEDVAFSYTFAANTFNDVDAGDSLSYSSALDDGSALPGWLSFNAGLRRYSGTPLNADVGVLTIVLTATDTSGAAVADTFELTVINTNDAPTDIRLDNTDVDENELVNTVVGNLSTTDQDSGDSHIYSLVNTGPCPGPGNGGFNINGAQLRTSAVFDHETADTHTICIRSDDGHGGTYDKQFVISVNDVNEAPMANDDRGPGFGTDKNTAFTTASVLANDDDPDVADAIAVDSYDDSGVLGILDYNGNGTFDYDPNGQFASLGPGEQVYEILTYVISDTAGLTGTATVTITVTGENTPPIANDDSGVGFEIDEDSVLTTGDVLSNDTDAETPASLTVHTYDDSGLLGVLDYNGDGTFEYDPNGQFEDLAVGGQVEEVFSYVVTDGVLTDSATVTISVTGRNDVPVAEDDTFTVDENSANGTVVGTVSASDPDTGDSLSYGITAGDTGDIFAIDGSTGEIMVNDSSALDYETTLSFALTVVVTDTSSLTDSASITINLNDVNEAPTVSDDTFTVDEGSVNGTSVGTISASDPDAGDSLSYGITAGNTGDAFAINGSTGEITVNNGSAFDYDTTPSFDLTVVVTDTGGLTDTATVQVTVNNQAPTAKAGGPYSGNEGSAISLDASGSFDPGGGDLTYAWDLDEDGVYDDATGVTLSHTWSQQVTLTVGLIITDTGGLTGTATVQVVVHDLDPIAEFTADPLSGDEPLTVIFTDTSTSYDGITVWWWDLNGDGSADATIPNPTFEYTVTGAYTVTLTVWEGDGDSDTETKVGYIRVGQYETYLPMVVRGG